MSEKKKKTGSICKTFCWQVGILAGAYLTYALVFDFGLEWKVAGPFGIVAFLLIGLLLRKLICRDKGSRVSKRKDEAKKKLTRDEQLEAHAQDRLANASSEAITDAGVAAATAASFLDKSDPEIETTLVADDFVDGPIAKSAPKAVRVKVKAGDRPKAAVSEKLVETVSEIDTPKLKLRGERPKADAKPAPKTIVVSQKPVAQRVEPPVVTEDEPSKWSPEKPKGLDTPRAGGADNLMDINGVDEDVEAALSELGIFHFDQISALNRKEIAWLDENIDGHNGEVSRLKWKRQAKRIVAGATDASA